MTGNFSSYLAVAAGGALGSVLRFWLANLIQHRAGAAFPWGSIAVNVIGSFLIGFIFCATLEGARFAASANWRNFLMVGVLGGFTTFSAFSLQTLELFRSGAAGAALLNVLVSVLLCLAVCAAGWWLGSRA
jgi:fluoride exporter